MTIEDIRKENQAVFDKIDATTPQNKRAEAYSSAYADILYETRKKANDAEWTLTKKRIAFVVTIIVGIVLAALGTFIMLSLKSGLTNIPESDTSGIMVKLISTIIPVAFYIVAAIVIIVGVCVRFTQKNNVKKYNEQVEFLEKYSTTDRVMRARIQFYEDTKELSASIEKILYSPSKSTSTSTSSSSSSSSEQSSGGYFSSPSNRVNYKDGYRDAGYSENGKLYDSNNRQIGYVDDNDKVYDNNYNAVGWFDDNGTYHNY